MVRSVDALYCGQSVLNCNLSYLPTGTSGTFSVTACQPIVAMKHSSDTTQRVPPTTGCMVPRVTSARAAPATTSTSTTQREHTSLVRTCLDPILSMALMTKWCSPSVQSSTFMTSQARGRRFSCTSPEYIYICGVYMRHIQYSISFNISPSPCGESLSLFASAISPTTTFTMHAQKTAIRLVLTPHLRQ